MDTWDPIGVKDIPQAHDEYDAYIGEVMELLMNGKPDDEIANHLHSIVTKQMGLPAGLEDMMPTVKALRAIPLNQEPT